jgi:sugar diacid utilization regulator
MGASISGLMNSFSGENREMLLIIGEFIDNSVGSAKKDGLNSVDVKIFIHAKKNAFYFIDNSTGIEKSDLRRIWRFYNLGDAYLNEGLNRGGIGFKHAGFWLGKKITIYSKNKSQEKSCTQLDFDEILALEKIQDLQTFEEESSYYIDYKNIDNNFYELVFNKMTDNTNTGTLIAIEDMNLSERTFANNIEPFQGDPDKPTKTGDGGAMNIYQQLYWRYERMIENKDNFKLNLSVIKDDDDGGLNEPIVINAKTVGFKGLTFDSDTFRKYVKNPQFEFSSIQSFVDSATDAQERKTKIDYGITIREIVTNLKEGNPTIEFYVPFMPDNPIKYDKLKVVMYLLDYKKIDNVFSSVRIMHGVEFIQDGRSINTAISTDSEMLGHIEMEWKAAKGEFDTIKNYWMAQIFLDSNNENNQKAFEPNDKKNKIKNTANVNTLIKSLKNAIEDLNIDLIFKHIIPLLRPKNSKRTELDRDAGIITNNDKHVQTNNNINEVNKDVNIEIADSLFKLLKKGKTTNAIRNIVREQEGAVLSSSIEDKSNYNWKHKISIDNEQQQFISLELDKLDYGVNELKYTFNFSKQAWNMNAKGQKVDWVVFSQFLVLYLNKIFFEELDQSNNVEQSIDRVNKTIEVMNLINEEGFN